MSQYENEEDRMLIAKAKKGDAVAFESLIKKYQKPIYYLCHRMTGAHQSADDLSQETFIKAYLSLQKFKEEMNFFTWIRKIAVNSTLNYLKIWKREKPLKEDVQYPTHNPGMHIHNQNQEMPLERLERTQMEEKFAEALKSLPSDQRAIFILKVYENQSYQNISQMLNIPQGTVMSRLNRARKKLKEAIAEFLEGGNR